MLDLDLVLAILHHLFVFALFAVLFAEFVTVRHGMDVLAALILITGFSRAILAAPYQASITWTRVAALAKGWEYYAHNAFFWAKIGTFVVIGLLSIPPTVAFLRWRRKGISPTDAAVAKVRPYLWIQMALFALLPAFAAAMARGYGEF